MRRAAPERAAASGAPQSTVTLMPIYSYDAVPAIRHQMQAHSAMLRRLFSYTSYYLRYAAADCRFHAAAMLPDFRRAMPRLRRLPLFRRYRRHEAPPSRRYDASVADVSYADVCCRAAAAVYAAPLTPPFSLLDSLLRRCFTPRSRRYLNALCRHAMPDASPPSPALMSLLSCSACQALMLTEKLAVFFAIISFSLRFQVQLA